MKRTFPQKAKPVPACAVEGRTMTGQAKQSLPEVNRRARTSAAMIGLAISMGAHSLLIHRQSDSAMAAEPNVPEASVTAIPQAFEAAMLSPTNEAETAAVGFSTADSVVEHTVQEGQTLWQLAQVYQVNPAVIAVANGVALDSVIHVGQTLKIPSASPAPIESRASHVEVVAPSPIAAAPSTPPTSLDADPLKQEEEVALERLKQKRDALQAGLAELKSEAKPTQAEVPTVEVPASAQTKSLQSEGEVAPQVAYQPPAATVTPSLPISAPPPEAKPTEVNRYRVKRGDTLDAIARKHGVSRAELVKFNRLSNPNFILVNQVLKVPQKSGNQPSGVIPGLAASSAPITIASNKPTVPATTGFNPVQEQSDSGLEVQLGAGSQPEFKGNVAAVPTTLPATIPSVPEILPVGAGGTASSKGQKVVAISPTASPSPQVDSSFSELNQNRYVENLRVEINQLRDKYEAEGKPNRLTTPTSETVKLAKLSEPATLAPATLPTAARQINPEFAPAQRSAAVSKPNPRQIRQVEQSPANQKAPSASQSQSDPELVAVAPLGSEAYEPIIQSALGQMVSPDLPPIGSAEAYLPEGAPQFKGHIWPAKGVLTSGYGWRWGRMHRGIDIAAPIGTPVVASAAGVVVTAGWNSGGYGNLVEIRHPDGSLTLYAHNNRILVREGQQVEQGQQIAEMGSTGYSTGPHSHFEVHLPGRGAVNPLAHLPRSRG